MLRMIQQQLRHYLFAPNQQVHVAESHGAERNRPAFFTGGLSKVCVNLTEEEHTDAGPA